MNIDNEIEKYLSKITTPNEAKKFQNPVNSHVSSAEGKENQLIANYAANGSDKMADRIVEKSILNSVNKSNHKPPARSFSMDYDLKENRNCGESVSEVRRELTFSSSTISSSVKKPAKNRTESTPGRTVFSPVLVRNSDLSFLTQFTKPPSFFSSELSRPQLTSMSSVFSPVNSSYDSNSIKDHRFTSPISSSESSEKIFSAKPDKNSCSSVNEVAPIAEVVSATNDSLYFTAPENKTYSSGDLQATSSSFRDHTVLSHSRQLPAATCSSKFVDIAVQTDDFSNNENSTGVKSTLPSTTSVQTDFDEKLEELEDRLRFLCQQQHSQILRHMQIHNDKLDSILRQGESAIILTKENERLKLENDRLKQLRFGKR